MKVKIKLSDGAVMPTYAKPGDAGMDLTAISEKVIVNEKFGYIEYGTGISLEIPEGYFIDIRPRSSISETGLFLANAPGTIDSQYRGELKCRFKWIPDTKKYEIGDRIAQIILLPYPKIEWEEVNELNTTERGDKGFGSTNN